MATELYESLHPKSEYFDKTRKLSPEEYFKRLSQSSTLYVGNKQTLSFLFFNR